jgi:hypothetical protein
VTRVAVLDDYQDVARSIGDWPAGLDVATFTDHLADPDALVERLQGFAVVVAMRERTAFPRAVLERLPDLRLLVTTGVRNAAIDVAAANELGVVVSGTWGIVSNTAELTWALILAVARHDVVDEVVVALVERPAAHHVAGVVDQDVEGAECGQGLVHDALDVGFVGDVTLDNNCLAASFAHPSGDRLGLGPAAVVVHRDPGAAAPKTLGHGRADTGAGAGHQHCLAAQVIEHVSSRFLVRGARQATGRAGAARASRDTAGGSPRHARTSRAA